MNRFVIWWRVLMTRDPKVGQEWISRQDNKTVVKVSGLGALAPIEGHDVEGVRFDCPDGRTRTLPLAEFVCFWRPVPPPATD